MGLNDQADADTLEQGQDDASITGQDGTVAPDVEPEHSEGNPTIDEQIDQIGGIEDWDAMREQAVAEMPGANIADSNRDEPPSADNEPNDEPEQPQPSGDTPKPTADDPANPQGDETENPDPNEEEEPPSPSSKRYRVRSEDPVELRAFELKARNPDMHIDECIAKAKAEASLNRRDNQPDGGEDDQGVMPDTVEATEARIAELEQERKTAMIDDLDFERADELSAEIRKLDRHASDLQYRGKQQEAEAEAADHNQYVEAFEQSKNKAIELYPFVTETGEETARMDEIDAQLRENGDPLYDDPNKPLIVAQMVARERGIAPKGKSTKADYPPKSGTPPRKNNPVQPANPQARTAPPKSNEEQLDEQLERIKGPLDWEAAMQEL